MSFQRNTRRDAFLAWGMIFLTLATLAGLSLWAVLAHAAGVGTVPPDGELEFHIARNWDTLVTNAGISAAVVVVLGILPRTPRIWLDERGALPLVAALCGVLLALAGAWGTHGSFVPSAVTGFLAGAAAAGVAKGYKDVARAVGSGQS